MDDPEELELVRRAIISRITGDCEWDERAARRVRDSLGPGLTPEVIKELLQDFVRKGGEVHQVPETREEYARDRRDYYKVIIPVWKFKHGLFVEIILSDDDPENPAVQIVNAHGAKKLTTKKL